MLGPYRTIFMTRQPQLAYVSFSSRLRDNTQIIPHSEGLFWTSYRSATQTATGLHTTLTKIDIHPPGGIRTCNPSKRTAADSRLKPRGHQERLNL